MIQFFITGTSSGIGHELALLALKEGHKVTGISRRNNIDHPNYKHLSYNLSSYAHYKLVNFNVNKEAEKTVLVNNAGWLGEVKPLGQIRPGSIERTLQINLVAPSILSKLFLEQTQSLKTQRILMNITSGAAQYPIKSWSTYCASKAGLDHLTRVINEDYPDVQALAVAPGVVDTEMQGEIRTLDEEDFPDRQRFVDYKKQGQLSDPQEVATALLKIIHQPDSVPDCVFSLRDYTP